ncbi:hypothetical protein, partial [Saccharothrix sp. ST-888]|uniref:hypothetical protein n=1 Tax=Saccharothrix sp. ST-888 TaxID=1427391 RepID=UPI0005EC0573
NRARYARTRQGTEVVVDGGPLDLVFTPVLPASKASGGTDHVTEYRGTATVSCLRVRPWTAGPAV